MLSSAALATLRPAPDQEMAILSNQRGFIDLRLERLIPNGGTDPLADAVRAACFCGGKRARPMLAMLSSVHFGGRELAALDFGCALEMVHTASLILDDLPCMDNGALRRGQLTLHRRFGEDTAVLSAVALLNQAYAVIAADDSLASETRLRLSKMLAGAVGFGGLAAGQMRDLRDCASTRDEASLTTLNHQKTGVLFVAAVEGGAVIAGADSAACGSARLFAERLGFAFQLWDDLQDKTSTPEITGKDVLQDKDRVTFVTLWGAERTRDKISSVIEEALMALGDRECPLAAYALSLMPKA
jgi:geranylgeranyl diphosphate synthase type II